MSSTVLLISAVPSFPSFLRLIGSDFALSYYRLFVCFSEHMLFLGTEKYPSENSYNAFLAQVLASSSLFHLFCDLHFLSPLKM